MYSPYHEMDIGQLLHIPHDLSVRSLLVPVAEVRSEIYATLGEERR